MRTFGYALLTGLGILALAMAMAIGTNLTGDDGWLGRDFAFAVGGFVYTTGALAPRGR